MKFAICTEIFYYEDADACPIARQFDTTAELGFAGIEIAPFTLADHVANITNARKQEILDASRQSGVAVAGIHWLLVGPQGMHVTSSDEAVREATARYMEDLVRFGVDIGGGMMVVGSPQQRDIREGVNFEDAWVWFKDTMACCAEVGFDADFRICIEPLAAETKNNFLRRSDEVLRMVAEIDMPNVGIILDTYSGTKEERDLPAAIRSAQDVLYHYHCNDDSGYAPGVGGTDFVPLMQALLDIDYGHFASIEVFHFDRPAVEHAALGLRTLQDALRTASAEA